MTVYKTIDVVGTSGTGVSDAVRAAVERASATIDDLSWFEVREIRGKLNGGEIAEFQVKVEIGFELRAADEASRGAGSAPARSARSVEAQAAAKRGERGREDLARGFEEQPGR